MPAYQDYTHRAFVSESYLKLSEVKVSIAEYYAKYGRYPNEAMVRKYTMPETAEYYSISVEPNSGFISIVLKHNNHQLDGKTLTVKPNPLADGYMQWACGSEDLLKKYLPSNCR